MLNKRTRLFETNSSSMHSIAVSSRDRGYDYDLPITDDGTLYVEFGEFGWGPDILQDPLEKLSYYITDQFGGYGHDDKSFEDVVRDILENQQMKDLIEILKAKVPGFKKLELGPASEGYRFGYVDHQSSGLTTGEDVEDLIFNNAKIIIIDNDNGSNYEDYYEPEEWKKGGHPHEDIEELWD